MDFLVIVLLASVIVLCDGKSLNSKQPTCGFESCNPVKDGMLNVHLVPHTHDDVGWLKTVDQYYYGARLDIQRAGVCYILDSVIPELVKDPSRRFIYVEIAFFWRWWEEQDGVMKSIVTQLVNEGRLEFTLGGWSMNDEGATHYNAIIDQHTLGLRFLNNTFGRCAHPRVAWQIDPFGHSRQQASLFAQIGYDALYFGRIDYQDKMTRLKAKTMEMIWRGSPDNIGEPADLFSGTLFNGYGPPSGFCYDLSCQDPPIMDDRRMHDYNVDYQVKSFLSAANDQSHHYTTNHIMMTMGSDFQYSNAHSWYKNLDKLIRYVNAEQANNSTVNVLYSTPSCYTYHVNKANQTYTTKEDDFFPYAIKPHGFLTGFYTSRPSLKGFVRDSNNALQIARQLQVLANIQDADGSFSKLFQLEEAMGIAQHHDAISGTEKQAVANDYTDRLARGNIAVADVISEGMSRLSGRTSFKDSSTSHCLVTSRRACAISRVAQRLQITAWNPLAHGVMRYLRLVVYSPDWTVHAANGVEIQHDVIESRSGDGAEIFIPVDIPPLGLSTFLFSKNTGPKRTPSNILKSTPSLEDTVVGNKLVSLVFDGTTGRLKQMNNLQQKISISLQQEFQYYLAFQGDTHDSDHQASGAYIFRPNTSTTETFPQQYFNTTYVKGELVQEIRQVFSPWASQTIRIFEGKTFVEIAWTIGPIPISDKQGKEVINLFKTDLKTNQTFYTDANGREIMKRSLNHRDTWDFNQTEPVAGNYYPVNSRISIQDNEKNIQFMVLTDRSEGGTSLRDGEIELMVHRRLLDDDHLGVGESLNETGADGKGLIANALERFGKIVLSLPFQSWKGDVFLLVTDGPSTVKSPHSAASSEWAHYLMLDTIPQVALQHRLWAEELFMGPMYEIAETQHTLDTCLNDIPTNKSFIERGLPANVHLLTLQQIPGEGSGGFSFLIFRLEHQFEKNEDPELSKPVSVNVTGLFTPFDVINIEELTLAANMPLMDLNRLKWRSAGSDNRVKHPVHTESADNTSPPDPFVITLNPMDIRTFKIEIFYKKSK